MNNTFLLTGRSQLCLHITSYKAPIAKQQQLQTLYPLEDLKLQSRLLLLKKQINIQFLLIMQFKFGFIAASV
ncbi:hypothetical protein C7B79_08990 [Chroococcidiopsis cubana CCALA 043]|nr:hypothetical protein C7B79_08990 [Chroococcidiopsis cubana CCALA 043]